VHGAKVSRKHGTRGIAGARHGDLWICMAGEHRRAVVRALWGLRATTPSAKGSGG
jgi:hypothetical protein